MKLSKLLLPTLRESPADTEIISHQLMVRAGLVRQLAAGIYTWLPLGLKVLRRVENIIREEMNRAGGQEILMSSVQPEELWTESGRWDAYGPELLRFEDRHHRQFCLGPTHEEIITDLVRREIRSYKQLPVNFYQIQTKFRDEIRPRYGIMRAREFLMKDAYSFHLDQNSLQETYNQMYATYSRIFDRIGLNYRAVIADTGNIGGSTSHEFHVLADSGEDQIAFSSDGKFAANVEMVEVAKPTTPRPAGANACELVDTPGQHTIEAVSNFLGTTPSQCVKTLMVEGSDNGIVALVLRGDHELNVIKAQRLPEVASPIRFAEAQKIGDTIGCGLGSLGPVGLQVPMFVDHAASMLVDFVCGANKDGQHLRGVNWSRDLAEPESVDIRNVTKEDQAPNDSGKILIKRGIEVGHIFQLGTKYSEALDAKVLDESGKAVTLKMGCYGIGVSRIVAAAVEQNHDERGIIWPAPIAPFDLAIAPINAHKSSRVQKMALSLYEKFKTANIDVLLYDGKERPGVMFANLELIGIPHRLVMSDRGLDSETLEYKGRTDETSNNIPLRSCLDFIKDKLATRPS
ncbi:MAG TPA: proline--tRNA ligase [Gammaproteobacteria bacterium]|nr:proline--tRNA ligase [Gammaproteobacteria bacterium]|tara:strand:- start:4114 stop:5832 length:1719 start_codon:yes stop_codon:yes gene_type:complete